MDHCALAAAVVKRAPHSLAMTRQDNVSKTVQESPWHQGEESHMWPQLLKDKKCRINIRGNVGGRTSRGPRVTLRLCLNRSYILTLLLSSPGSHEGHSPAHHNFAKPKFHFCTLTSVTMLAVRCCATTSASKNAYSQYVCVADPNARYSLLSVMKMLDSSPEI